MKSEHPAPREMSRDECLQTLSATNVGRIALSERALPTIVPVVYVMAPESIVFHAGGGLLSTAVRQGHVVCFEADVLDGDLGTLSSVTIVGQLDPAGGDATPGEVAISTSVLRGREQGNPLGR